MLTHRDHTEMPLCTASICPAYVLRKAFLYWLQRAQRSDIDLRHTMNTEKYHENLGRHPFVDWVPRVELFGAEACPCKLSPASYSTSGTVRSRINQSCEHSTSEWQVLTWPGLNSGPLSPRCGRSGAFVGTRPRPYRRWTSAKNGNGRRLIRRPQGLRFFPSGGETAFQIGTGEYTHHGTYDGPRASGIAPCSSTAVHTSIWRPACMWLQWGTCLPLLSFFPILCILRTCRLAGLWMLRWHTM